MISGERNRRLRILVVMASGATGGGANHLRLLLPALARLGIEPHAAVGPDGPLAEGLRAAGVPTDVIELMHSRVDPRGPLRLARLIRRHEPDLIHYHGTRAAFFGALARLLAPTVPVIYTAHGLAYRKPARAYRRMLMTTAERLACAAAVSVVSVSEPDLADLIARRFVRAERAIHIENPVDGSHFAGGSRSESRARLGLEQGELIAVTVARLVPQKAVGDAIEAIARCRRPIRLVVIGDGPERSELEARARARAARVTFLGERHDVAALWPAFDAFVLSSRWEGEPLALLEAMAAAVPCIATATAGAATLLAGGAGRLVPVGDPAALERALDDIVMLTPAARSSFTIEARARVQRRSPDRIAARLAAVYEQALSRGRNG